MPHSMINLADELQLKIIIELVQHDELLHDESTIKKTDSGYVRENDDEFMYHRDLMNWSCTSSYFRNLLAPYVFKSVKLRNDEKSGESVTALLKGPFGALVEELYFIGTAPDTVVTEGAVESPQAEGSQKQTGEVTEEQDELPNIALPSTVSTILSDLHQFPNLKSLSMGFTYPYADSPFDEYYEVENIDNIEDPNPGLAWRALMATTYETLSHNKEPQFKELEIRRLVWTYVGPFESDGFHELLKQMEHFTLSVRGGNNGAGWHVNTCEGYLQCVSRFDELFFNHLASAVTVNFEAPEEGPIGLEGMNHGRLALNIDQMPLLRELHLEYCFICEELAQFVESHADTLEVLTLHSCTSSVNGLQDTEPFYWKDLFNTVHAANLTRLSKLEVLPSHVPLTSDEEYSRAEKVKEEDEPVEVQEVRRLLREDPKRRLFGYASLDDKYGMVFQDEEENVAAFQRGEDQTAYDRVMDKIEAMRAVRLVVEVGE